MVQWLGLQAPDAEGLGSIPSQKKRSQLLQLRGRMLKWKILHAVTKTLHNQINEYIILSNDFLTLVSSLPRSGGQCQHHWCPPHPPSQVLLPCPGNHHPGFSCHHFSAFHLFCFPLAAGLWNFQSPTRDWTQTLGSESTNHWPAREFPAFH